MSPRVFVVTIATVAAIAMVVPARVVAGTCWLPPVEAPVVDPFREPACRWCPGNRGIEYRVGAATPVRAVAAGVVSYAGSVAGVTYVVVAHPDGRRTTYGRLVDRTVVRGDRVVARMRVGTASGSLHFGVRVGERYVDPAPLLGRLVGRPRLVPLDGTSARPAPPPSVRCVSDRTSR